MGALLQLRSELEARFDTAFDLRKPKEINKINTGIRALDEIAQGGVPRGELTEIIGPESSGRTAILIALASQATRYGECCAWIDAEGMFDPISATAANADLERILWVNCAGNAEHALQATDLLIQAGGFGLVILDLADTPEKTARRISLASWFRLRHAAERTNAALVAASRRVNARSCSALQIELRRTRPVWAGRLLGGLGAKAEGTVRFRVKSAEFTAAGRWESEERG
jgi:recombination protein RecA